MKIRNKTLRNGILYGAIFGLVAVILEEFVMMIFYILSLPIFLASTIFYKIAENFMSSESAISYSTLVDNRMIIIMPLAIIFYALAGLGIAYLVVLYRQKIKK